MIADEPFLPKVLSHWGDQDGIRWGDLAYAFPMRRRYVYDLISRQIAIYQMQGNRGDEALTRDRDPTRVIQALDAVRAYGKLQP